MRTGTKLRLYLGLLFELILSVMAPGSPATAAVDIGDSERTRLAVSQASVSDGELREHATSKTQRSNGIIRTELRSGRAHAYAYVRFTGESSMKFPYLVLVDDRCDGDRVRVRVAWSIVGGDHYGHTKWREANPGCGNFKEWRDLRMTTESRIDDAYLEVCSHSGMWPTLWVCYPKLPISKRDNPHT